jgi:hypothetical protein
MPKLSDVIFDVIDNHRLSRGLLPASQLRTLARDLAQAISLRKDAGGIGSLRKDRQRMRNAGIKPVGWLHHD